MVDLKDTYSMEAIIAGVADDLRLLRAGKISVDDARARAELLKQFMNGIRLAINVRQSLAIEAKHVNGASKELA
jgi:hypothetical protein